MTPVPMATAVIAATTPTALGRQGGPRRATSNERPHRRAHWPAEPHRRDNLNSPSAIAGAVLAARSGGRSVREVISSEMWECLNVAALGLPRQRIAAERLGPHIYLQFIRERAALSFGLADSTMSHDDAWRFLVLGRSVERVDMTARMLLARLPFTTADDLQWPTLLHACGAYESFIRTRSWTGGSNQVAEFLLLDRQFPRSVVHALVTAEECLAALDPSPAEPARATWLAGPSGGHEPS